MFGELAVRLGWGLLGLAALVVMCFVAVVAMVHSADEFDHRAPAWAKKGWLLAKRLAAGVFVAFVVLSVLLFLGDAIVTWRATR